MGCSLLFRIAILYPLLFALSVMTFWGLSSSLTLHLVKKQGEWRRQLLREALAQNPPGEDLIVPQVTQLTNDPPMWRVSSFLSDGEVDYLKEAYSPTFTSCFPGAPETLVWWLGRWSSWGSIRVCQEMNQELERGHGNELLEDIEQRILGTLRDSQLYLGRDGRGNGFALDEMDFQLVRYRRGGKFRYHFDEDFHGNALPMTYMVYLSDQVANGGGGTSFPRANDGKGMVVGEQRCFMKRAGEIYL